MPERRQLSFTSLDEVMPEVERLLAGCEPAGQWTLGQICRHLTTGLHLMIDGVSGFAPSTDPEDQRVCAGPRAVFSSRPFSRRSEGPITPACARVRARRPRGSGGTPCRSRSISGSAWPVFSPSRPGVDDEGRLDSFSLYARGTSSRFRGSATGGLTGDVIGTVIRSGSNFGIRLDQSINVTLLGSMCFSTSLGIIHVVAV